MGIAVSLGGLDADGLGFVVQHHIGLWRAGNMTNVRIRDAISNTLPATRML